MNSLSARGWPRLRSSKRPPSAYQSSIINSASLFMRGAQKFSACLEATYARLALKSYGQGRGHVRAIGGAALNPMVLSAPLAVEPLGQLGGPASKRSTR